MIATLVFAALCLVPGLPAALALRRRDQRLCWGEVVVEGVLLGLGWWLLAGLALAHAGRFELVPLALVTVAATAALVALALPALRRLPRPRPSAVGAAALVVVAVGAWLRRDPFYLLYQTSDMSEYLRAGNALARGEPLGGYFLHLYKVPLGLSSVLLGQASAVAVLPFLGLVVPVGVASIARRAGAGPVAALVVLALAVADPLAVWFGRFPASETLYAALFVAFSLLVVEAVRRRSVTVGVLAGVVTGLLVLTRGNAVLLAPLVVVAVVVAATLVPRTSLRPLLAVGATVPAATYAGFVYDSRYSGAYFIEHSLREDKFVPLRFQRYVDSLGGLPDAAIGAVVVVASTALVLAAATAFNRLPPGRWRSLLLPSLLVVELLALAGPLPIAGVADGFGRMGWGLLALGAVGLVGLAVSAREPAAQVVASVVVVVGGAFSLFHAYRFDEPRPAPYFLYWDRYLYSEVFPLLCLAAAAGVVVVAAGLRNLRAPAHAGEVAVGALALLGVVAVAQLASRNALPRERELFGGAYDQVVALDRLTSSPEPLPIVWDGLAKAQLPPGWDDFNPNTYRVLATPLQESFGRTFLNPIAGGLVEDPRVGGDDDVADLLRGYGTTQAYVVTARPLASVRTASVRAEGPVTTTPVGTLEVEIPLLRREVDPDDERWTELALTLDVTLVELR